MNNDNAYDIKAKRILSKKEVLVNIMQALIPEYKDLSFEEVYKLIDDNEGSDVVAIKEETQVGASKIISDLVITPRLPNSNETIGMYIGIESQNYYTRYRTLLRRAVYYAADLIIRQKGEVFTNDDYEKIRKIYSIWICANPINKLKNTILKYKLIPEFDLKEYGFDNDDLMNVVFLNVGDNYDYETKDILKMLSLIFTNTNLPKEQVTDILEKGYNVDIEEKSLGNMSSR